MRDILSGGSFRDIAPKVKQVTAEIAAKEQAARVASEIPEGFRDAAAAMWQLAWELADEIAASDRQAHAVEIERLKSEVDEALANCALVEDKPDDAEMRVQDLEKWLEEAKGLLHDAQLEIARLDGRLMEREKDIVSRVKRPKATRTTEHPTDDADDAPPVTEDDTQLDMFPNDKPDGEKPDDQKPIPAE